MTVQTYIYHCKKNGKSYTYTSVCDSMESPRDQYAWRRGVREYADNYTASVTLGGANPWKGTRDEFNAEIDRLCTEAHTRFHSDDVPSERGYVVPPVLVAAVKYGLSEAEQLAAMEAFAKSKAEAEAKAAKESAKVLRTAKVS